MNESQSIWSTLAAAARSVTRRGVKGSIRKQPALRSRGQLPDWTDAELYKVWRATSEELLNALYTEQADHTMTASEARRHLLAEIEHRYPRATAAWLASDALLSGEPPQFLLHDT
jgi:hypothetical protein